MVILELIHASSPDSCGRDVFIRFKTNAGRQSRSLVIHSNCSERRASRRRRIIQVSALSTVDGTVSAYHGCNG